MLNKIAGQAKSAFHSSSFARMTQPAAIAASRVAPARSSLPSASSIPHGSELSTSVRSRSASFMPMPPGLGRPVPPSPRDWPSVQDRPGDVEEISPAGTAARLAAAQAPRDRANRREAIEMSFRTGAGIEPGYSQNVTGISMAFGLERSAEKLLEDEGAGVAAGLRELSLQPGDAVAELNPTEPGLAVRLAMDGARTWLLLSFPNRLSEVNKELERFAKGKTCGVRTFVPGVAPLPDAHYREGARKVAGLLTPMKAASFSVLPQGVSYKALIARGVFELLDSSYADGLLRDAGRILEPGGGLVFEFAHAAGTSADPQSKVKLQRLEFRQLDEAARQSGLALKCMNVRFRLAETPHEHVIPARRVVADADGIVDLRKADAAAWTGWNEIARVGNHKAQPVLVDVSGVFVKAGKRAAD